MAAWIYLSIAISLEIVATFCLKLSNGFEKWQWGMVSILCYSVCFWFLAPALKVLPVGIVYAIWAGVGIVGATILSVLVFNDRILPYQYGFIALIMIGAVGLKLTTNP